MKKKKKEIKESVEEFTPLCHRCEHRARFFERGHAPRCECGTVGQAVGSCYMYKPVQPVLLRANDGEKRPIVGVGSLFAGRSHGVKGNPAYQGYRAIRVKAADEKPALLLLPVYDLAAQYPRLAALKVKMSPGGFVPHKALASALRRAKMPVKTFGEYFGVQTQSTEGAYPWDVEAVLERMLSGKKTGSQLVWD